MTSKSVLITRAIPEIAAIELKKHGFNVVQWQEDRPIPKEELIERAQDCEALLTSSSEKLDRHFFEQCAHLKIISQISAGYDNIDVQAATEIGVPVGHAPDAMSEATADIAFALMLTTSRKMFYNHKKIIQNEWGFTNLTAHLGMELKNKKLGVFGLGKIGMKMAERCRGAYNMKVLYHNRNRNELAESELSAQKVDFDTLLKESDVLTVHCALTDSTKGLFEQSAFKKMKSTSIFINTARGGIHNEAHLIEALEQGEIWGAGLDVTNPEPMLPDNPLLQMENVSVVPHIGSATQEARNNMARFAAENIISFYEHGTIPYLINKGVMMGGV